MRDKYSAILIPIAEEAMKAKNEIFFVGGDLATLDRGTEIVHPAKAAALAAAEQSRPLGEGPPASLTFLLDVIGQKLILLRCPRPPLQTDLAAARRGRGRLRRPGTSFWCCRCCWRRRRRWVPHVLRLFFSLWKKMLCFLPLYPLAFCVCEFACASLLFSGYFFWWLAHCFSLCLFSDQNSDQMRSLK